MAFCTSLSPSSESLFCCHFADFCILSRTKKRGEEVEDPVKELAKSKKVDVRCHQRAAENKVGNTTRLTSDHIP
jgi:hypothetical protein